MLTSFTHYLDEKRLESGTLLLNICLGNALKVGDEVFTIINSKASREAELLRNR